MGIKNQNTDPEKAFDWGRTSAGYMKYRDTYPKVFYEKIMEGNLCVRGQKVLDLGVGIGALLRSMYVYRASWVGIGISKDQIGQAKGLAGKLGQEMKYLVAATEDVDYPDGIFDVIIACQCFWHFDHERAMPKLARMLKPDGRLLLLYMAWLPYEDNIAGESEKLVLKYSPDWSEAGETIHPIHVSPCIYKTFGSAYHKEYKIEVPFIRGTWSGRVKSCHGVEASLPPEEVEQWERERKAMLEQITPGEFMVKHYTAMLELKGK